MVSYEELNTIHKTMSRIQRILIMVVAFMVWINVTTYLHLHSAWFYMGCVVIGVIINIISDMIDE